jgi:hypothetical protein
MVLAETKRTQQKIHQPAIFTHGDAFGIGSFFHR